MIPHEYPKRAQQVRQVPAPGRFADVEQERTIRSDPAAAPVREQTIVGNRAEQPRVDTLGDDVNALGRDTVELHHVASAMLADRADDRRTTGTERVADAVLQTRPGRKQLRYTRVAFIGSMVDEQS